MRSARGTAFGLGAGVEGFLGAGSAGTGGPAQAGAARATRPAARNKAPGHNQAAKGRRLRMGSRPREGGETNPGPVRSFVAATGRSAAGGSRRQRAPQRGVADSPG